MKNIERAAKKYNYNKLGFLANMNLIKDLNEMFAGIMDERIASGKMPAGNKEKAIATIKGYLDYVWEQDMTVANATLCELYDYLAAGDLNSALWMVQKKSLASICA